MSLVQNGAAILCVCAGLFFMLTGSIGLLRLPDFFSRTHATSKTDTLGIILLLVGLAIYEGFTIASAKLLVAAIFVVLANPVTSHALARAALHSGLKPLLGRDWRKKGTNAVVD